MKYTTLMTLIIALAFGGCTFNFGSPENKTTPTPSPSTSKVQHAQSKKASKKITLEYGKYRCVNGTKITNIEKNVECQAIGFMVDG